MSSPRPCGVAAIGDENTRKSLLADSAIDIHAWADRKFSRMPGIIQGL
jgi:hypothetical protein